MVLIKRRIKITMKIEIKNLPITDREIESLIDLGVLESITLDLYRGLYFRELKYIFSALFTEGVFLFLILIVVMPLTVITVRNSGDSPHNISFFILVFLLALIILLLMNLYLWKKVHKIRSLAKLIREIEKYNKIISTLQVMANIELASDRAANINYEVLSTLALTRESLTSALRLERIIRKNYRLMENFSEILTDLETSLATLMNFEVSQKTDDYSRLFNETLKISTSVYKEVRNLKK